MKNQNKKKPKNHKMNKTIDINLGGMLFHLDENAYYKLKKYLDAVKSSLQHQEDVDEVMSEIEARIAELFLEKQAHPKEVVNIQYINEVVDVMGQPEDYEETADETPKSANYRVKKGLFRDLDRSVIGGVGSGLAHYIGIDVTIMRLLLLLILFFTHGSIVLIYLLLWIVIPKAKTASDKLRMKGEKVDVDSIADQVSAEDDFSKKKINLGEKVENVTTEFSNVIVKILGFFIALITGSILISLIVSALSLSPLSDVHIMLVDTPFYSGLNMPFGWINVLVFIVVGFPVGMLFLLGVKMLFDNAKTINKNIFIVGGTIWFLSLIFIIVKTTSLMAHKKESAGIVTKQAVLPFAKDTIELTIDKHLLKKTRKSGSNHSIDYYFKPSNNQKFHFSIEKISEGIDIDEAKRKAERIEFAYKIDSIENKITFSNRLLYPAKDFVQDHDIDVTIYVPKGKFVHLSKRINAHTPRIICRNEAVLMNKNDEIICVTEDEDTTQWSSENDDDKATEVLNINGKNINVKVTEDGLDIYTDDNDAQRAHIKIDEEGIKIDAKGEKDAVNINIDENGLKVKTNNKNK
jgi:phage shock protein PspC (stress-responsive transcriptional regulator)